MAEDLLDLATSSEPEGQHLEYKSTLREDLKLGEKSKILECVIVKTIAAFLNSWRGGTLLIGVADDGSVVGLDHDFATLHKDGKTTLTSSSCTQVHVNGGSICRVHVEPSGPPCTPRYPRRPGRPPNSSSASTTPPARTTTRPSRSAT